MSALDKVLYGVALSRSWWQRAGIDSGLVGDAQAELAGCPLCRVRRVWRGMGGRR